MPIHTVEQGECLSSIARDFGFPDWRIIYNHAQNADFRRRRPNPNLIFPGDQLFIPEVEIKHESGSTDQEHVFEVPTQRTMVRIRLQDENNQPFANKNFRLEVEGQLKEGVTGGDGLIEQEVAQNARSGELT